MALHASTFPLEPLVPLPSARPPRTCQQCGTASTAQWRYGHNGSFLMCNACGIRWRRKNHSGTKRRRPGPRAPPAAVIIKRHHAPLRASSPPLSTRCLPWPHPAPLHSHEREISRSASLYAAPYAPPPLPPPYAPPPLPPPCMRAPRSPPRLHVPRLPALSHLPLRAPQLPPPPSTHLLSEPPKVAAHSPLSIRSLLNDDPVPPPPMPPCATR